MRFAFPLVCSFLIAIGFVSCAREVDRDAEAQQIREIVGRFSTAVASADTAALADFYAEDAVLMPPNTARIPGRDGIRSFWASMVRTPNFSLTLTSDSVLVARSGDLAVETGIYQLTMNAPGGHVTDTGKYSVAYKRVGTDWKIAVDIFNSDMPPAAIAAADTAKAR